MQQGEIGTTGGVMKNPDPRLKELIFLYLDRQASDDEIRELTGLLAGDMEARREMAELVNQHMTLHSLFAPAVAHEMSAEPVSARTARPPSALRTEKTFWHRPVLALAASLMIAAGVVYYFKSAPVASPPATSVYRIALKSGDVSVRDELITTGSNSFCRVEYPDQTIIAVDSASRTKLSQDIPVSGKQIQLDQGRIYVDAPRIGKKLAVVSGFARCEIAGTRFMAANHRGNPGLLVLEGAVKFSRDQSVVYAAAGQAVTCRGPNDESFIDIVSTENPTVKTYEWLEKAGVSVASLPTSVARPKSSPTEQLIDFGNYAIRGGTWRIVYTNGSHVVRQENPASKENTIYLGRPQWTEGEYTFKYRVLAPSLKELQSGSSIAIVLHTTSAGHSFGVKRWLKVLLEDAARKDPEAWIVMRTRFKFSRSTLIGLIEAWPASDPSAVKRIAFKKSPKGSSLIRADDVFGLGLLSTGDCAVEFKDFSFKDKDIQPLPADLLEDTADK
ncbi:MAG: hypothetical protein C0404_06885 [Verrucomicrobia bacterium]|nr:hypothetical protein [Verrucomicrobiota bacterium]